MFCEAVRPAVGGAADDLMHCNYMLECRGRTKVQEDCNQTVQYKMSGPSM